MKEYEAKVYEHEGRYAIVVFGKNDKPKKISWLDIISIEQKQEGQCIARGCRYYRHTGYDMCLPHALALYGSVITSVQQQD